MKSFRAVLSARQQNCHTSSVTSKWWQHLIWTGPALVSSTEGRGLTVSKIKWNERSAIFSRPLWSRESTLHFWKCIIKMVIFSSCLSFLEIRGRFHFALCLSRRCHQCDTPSPAALARFTGTTFVVSQWLLKTELRILDFPAVSLANRTYTLS